LKLLINSYCCN